MNSLNETKSSIQRYTICIWLSGICSLIFIGIGIFGYFFFGKLIQGQINQNIALQEDTIDLWGQNPGQIGIITSRQFVFFQFANPWRVSFYNETPIFIEQDPLYYQEFYNFTNPVWVENQNIVNFNYWTYFKAMNQTTGNEVINTMNVGPMGAWWTVKNSPDSAIALNVLSGLIYGFKDALLPSVYAAFIAQNLNLNNLPTDQAQAKQVIYGLLDKNGITGAQADFMYSDKLYGLSSNLTLDIWTQSALYGMDRGASVIIKNYFKLTDEQFDGLLEYMQVNVQSANESLVQNYYCNRYYQSENCTGLMLGIVQWINQGITMNPPLDGQGTPSIVSPANLTTQGYPEISFFLKKYFYEKISSDPKYQQVTFTLEQGAQWAEMSDNDNDWVKAPYALLHKGNLEFLFANGDYFDQTKNQANLTNIQNRFLLTNLDQAFVFWKYIQYLVVQFAEQRSKQGSSGSAAIGAIVGGGVYEAFNKMKDYLLPKITSELVFRNLTVNSTTSCQKLISNSVTDDPISQANLTAICSQPGFVNWTSTTVEALIDVCDYQESQRAVQFRKYMNRIQFDQLCEKSSKAKNFGSVIFYYDKYIQKMYNCTTFGDKCSQFQIALKQWSQSLITSNVPNEIIQVFPASETIKDWAPQLFHTPIQIGVILKNLSDTFQTPVQVLSESEALSLLNFDRLFSGTLISAAFLLEKSSAADAASNFTKLWVFKEPKQLISYFRYMALYYTFGGFSQERTAKELLFGYKDPFVDTLINQNPQQGGDPCANTLVAFNEPNATIEQAQITGRQSMYTGINDPQMVRQYRDYLSYETDFIAFNQTWFDGNQCHTSLQNPWMEKVKLRGSDGGAFPPITDQNAKQYAYLSSVFQIGQIEYKGQKVNRAGFDTLHYTLSECNIGSIQRCPSNKIYYSQFDGVMNLTSALGLPLYNSKGHYQDAEPAVINSNKIYKQENNSYYLMSPSIYDDTYLNIEPNTGTAFNIILVLQVSFLLQGGDELFPYPFRSFMPIFYIYRSANLTDDQINENFSDLKTGFKIQKIAIIVGLTVGGVLLFLTIFLIIRRRKLIDSTMTDSISSNQISLMNADGNNMGGENEDRQKEI